MRDAQFRNCVCASPAETPALTLSTDRSGRRQCTISVRDIQCLEPCLDGAQSAHQHMRVEMAHVPNTEEPV